MRTEQHAVALRVGIGRATIRAEAFLAVAAETLAAAC
jgi:hypothetical protein